MKDGGDTFQTQKCVSRVVYDSDIFLGFLGTHSAEPSDLLIIQPHNRRTPKPPNCTHELIPTGSQGLESERYRSLPDIFHPNKLSLRSGLSMVHLAKVNSHQSEAT